MRNFIIILLTLSFLFSCSPTFAEENICCNFSEVLKQLKKELYLERISLGDDIDEYSNLMRNLKNMSITVHQFKNATEKVYKRFFKEIESKRYIDKIGSENIAFFKTGVKNRNFPPYINVRLRDFDYIKKHIIFTFRIRRFPLGDYRWSFSINKNLDVYFCNNREEYNKLISEENITLEKENAIQYIKDYLSLVYEENYAFSLLESPVPIFYFIENKENIPRGTLSKKSYKKNIWGEKLMASEYYLPN